MKNRKLSVYKLAATTMLLAGAFVSNSAFSAWPTCGSERDMVRFASQANYDAVMGCLMTGLGEKLCHDMTADTRADLNNAIAAALACDAKN